MDTFSGILSEYTTLAKTDPLRTWILFENTDLANAAVKKLRDEGAILPDHITTIKGLAKSILRSLSPAARIIDPEEQHLIFARIGADVLGKKRITDTQTENHHKKIRQNPSKLIAERQKWNRNTYLRMETDRFLHARKPLVCSPLLFARMLTNQRFDLQV